MREWLEINGRRFIWEDLIECLENYKQKTIIKVRGSSIRMRYNHMICVLQEMAFDYHEGKDCISDERKAFFERHYMNMPSIRQLPEAVEELFNQMQEKLQINLEELLDECVQVSEVTYELMKEAERGEEERIAFIRLLPLAHENIAEKDVLKKVSYLMELQRAKMECPEYKVSRQETMATGMWCEILVLSLSCDVITNGIMRKVIENGFLSENEMTQLIRGKCRIEKDYEWYSEDFLGCALDTLTDIRIEDFLELCRGRFMEALGIRNCPPITCTAS